MKKLILFISLTTLLASCGKNKEIYLFEKGSAEENAYRTYLATQCEKSNPKLIKNLEATDNFDMFFSGNITNKYYKIKRTYKVNKSEAETDSQYLRLQKLSNSSLRIYVSKSTLQATYQGEEQNVAYSFDYSSEDNTSMRKYIVSQLCKKSYGGSLGKQKSSFQYTSSKKVVDDSNAKVFDSQDNSFTVNTDKPVILSRWNASTKRVRNYLSDENDDNGNPIIKEKSYTYTKPQPFTEIKETDCTSSACLEIKSGSVQDCSLEINLDHTDIKDPKVFLTKTKVNCGAVPTSEE